MPQGHDRARVRAIAAFIRTLARLAALADEELTAHVSVGVIGTTAKPPPGVSRIDARYALLFSTLEVEQAAVARARTTYRGTEAQRILGLAQVAYGDLRGLLAGVSAEALDRVPREGEWSAREALKHATLVERSYRANTAHALRRGADEPLTVPAELRPTPDPADTAGDGSDIAERLGVRRAETDAELAAISDEQLTRASQWGDLDVDVRFRLHRFASHVVEHTVQCERALETAGTVNDARRVVRRISVMRAMHERITPLDELARLDARHEARILTPASV